MQLETAFQNPQLCHSLLDRLNRALDGRSMRFMEVCGTHTVAIFQSGLRSLLPSSSPAAGPVIQPAMRVFRRSISCGMRSTCMSEKPKT